jgi:hypothetical protein
MSDTTDPGLYQYEVTATVRFRLETDEGSPASGRSKADDLTLLEEVWREFLKRNVLADLTEGFVVVNVDLDRHPVIDGIVVHEDPA